MRPLIKRSNYNLRFLLAAERFLSEAWVAQALPSGRLPFLVAARQRVPRAGRFVRSAGCAGDSRRFFAGRPGHAPVRIVVWARRH